ncbi:ABC transporter substrate-binding protein [Paenibacillus sp. y28]|uniref:ABC transporter substrate-binding protein n=1 Tax=Paenibacillus sp. y28 TaxID=3129110 RepID=UPI0030186F98
MPRWKGWKGWKGLLLILVLSLVAVLPGVRTTTAAPEEWNKLAPHDNQGKKYRLAYVETDPFFNYAGTFYYLVKGLERLGWITSTEGMPFSPSQEDSKVMWDWLADRDMGPNIEFVKDAHYSLISMPPDGADQIMDRLNTQKDIDLMIVMGTSPGQKLANDRHHVPTMVFSSSNAVQSGIIQSETDSGLDHVWAHMDLTRYKRQVQVFHDIFQFKKLGMVYENSELGRIYAAVDDVRDVAAERGFELVELHVDEPKSPDDRARYNLEVQEAFRKLSTQVDAVYLTAGKWDQAKLSLLLEPLYAQKVPVFSQLGSGEVARGALLSLYRANFSGIGYFGAENMVQALNGTPLRKLPQIFGDTPSIVMNLEVANRIGYKTPFDILLAADEIYTSIKK